MRYIYLFLQFALGIFMIFGGYKHFSAPSSYYPFVPSLFNDTLFWVYASGVVEIVLGSLLLFTGRIAKVGTIGIIVLLVLFLPIHINDLFIDKPAIGSLTLAIIRVPFQFLFIGWAYLVLLHLQNKN